MSSEPVRLNISQFVVILSSPDSTAPPGLPSLVNGFTIYLLPNLKDGEPSWEVPVPLIPSTQLVTKSPKSFTPIVSSPSPTVLGAQERFEPEIGNLDLVLWSEKRWSRKRMKMNSRSQGQSLEDHIKGRTGKLSKGG